MKPNYEPPTKGDSRKNNREFLRLSAVLKGYETSNRAIYATLFGTMIHCQIQEITL